MLTAPSQRSRALPFRVIIGIASLLPIACSQPDSFEQFIKADDAPGGVYEFVIPAIPDGSQASAFDISLFTSPLRSPLQLNIRWMEPADMPEGRDSEDIFSERVWFPAGEHQALYRSGVAPELKDSSKNLILRIRPINPPEDLRGLGIILNRNDGTR